MNRSRKSLGTSFVKGLEKARELFLQGSRKNLGTVLVKGLDRNLRTRFRHESRETREPFSSRGNFFREGSREHLGTFVVKGLESRTHLGTFFVKGLDNNTGNLCSSKV